ncbi:MAG: flagellin, partial [Candidatus Geothermincolales bacterium]
DALIEVRTLAIQAANDTLSPSDRENIAQRMDEFNELIFKLTHERYSGRYVFSGTRTDDPPFVRDGDDVVYQGNSAHIRVNIGEGAPVAFNLTGDEVFMGIGDQGRSLFKLLSDLAAAIRQGDARRVGGELLGEIDEALDRVAEKLGVVGAVAQRLEKMEEVISGLMVKHRELLSLAEDADLAEAVMDFQFKQTAYQASLAACARAIMPTILDYLK